MSRFPQARFLLSVAALAQFPADHGVEVAFAGRSNAGKSSAINAILARRSLARTGKTPGQTRLLNYFDLGAERRLVDLPGYGYARVSERERLEWGPLLERLRERRSLCGLFLIVDARRGVGPLDLELIEWARPEVRRIHVLLAKADKLNRADAAKALSGARQVLEDLVARTMGCRAPTVQSFSALTGHGIAEAQQVLSEWLGQAPDREGAAHKKTPGTSEEATGAD